MPTLRYTAAAILPLLLSACPEGPPEEVLEEAVEEAVEEAGGPEGFLASLESHCGEAFQGEVLARPEADTSLDGDPEVIMHLRHCAPDRILIPVHVGDDRSRTWVITRTPDGLDLRHDHRHPDGTPEENTCYGAPSRGTGSEHRQTFVEERADGALAGWVVEVHPRDRFEYATVADGEYGYHFRFDLGRPVAPPPEPWGDDLDPC